MLRLCAAVILLAPALAAQPEGDQRAFLDLFVNDAAADTVLVRLRGQDMSDAFVAVADLEKAGLHGLRGAREMHDGREYVSLRSLDPQVKFALDLSALSLKLTAAPALLETTQIDLSPVSRPRDLVLRTDASGFFNYSVTGTTQGEFSGAAEVGASFRGNLATTGFTVDPGGSVVRGMSEVVLDDPSHLRRLTLGDAVATTTPLGGSALLAGVSLAREFSLDPYFVRQPLPRLSGAVLSPSTLDVYVNGLLVREQQVNPGTFEAWNLPATTGAGSVSYVVRDAFGRTQEFASPYYASAGVLAEGISDYGYHLGFQRAGFGQESFHYGPPAFSAYHRIGFGNQYTPGFRLESALNHGSAMASGGPTLATALPAGELDAEAAASVDGSAAGAAGSLGWSFYTRRINAAATVRAMTANYSTLARPASADKPLLQLLGTVGAPVNKVLTLALEGQVASMRDAGLTSVLSLRADLHLTRDLSLLLSSSRSRSPGTGPQWGAFATLVYSFGGGTTADASATAASNGMGSSAGVQKATPLGEGWAYQVRGSTAPAEPALATGQVQYQGAHGSYFASYTRAGASQSASGTAAGALVLVDGNVLAARPVQQGYALVQVPGVEGVRGYLNNQEIGRTDSNGNLLIPALQPYYGNRLRISDSDVPFAYRIGNTEQVIATSERGGALVKFDVERVNDVKGLVRIETDGRRTVPAFGELNVAGHTSPIGSNGEFWLEHLSAGKHEAEVEFKEGICKFELDIAAAAPGMVDLGTIACTRLVSASADQSAPAQEN
jgi:outer membrane usher protein